MDEHLTIRFPGSQDDDKILLRRRFGGKGGALAELMARGFQVPEWFAVAAAAEGEQRLNEGKLAVALERLGGERFAVRSSGIAEDGAETSFAGQFDSFLEVAPTQVLGKISEVLASAGSERVRRYCVEHGLPLPVPPVVLVQRMISPRWAGVAFSADPVTGRRAVAVVNAVEGTAEKLVSGETDGRCWNVDREGQVISADGQHAGEEPKQDEIRAVAALARECEAALGLPQDIEWALDGTGKLWLLQSRAITTLRRQEDPQDPLLVWDHSNIAESYGGVTTPLTFTFARRAYEAVYREFCQLMGVTDERIARADATFPRMLGLVRGRVYYNLVSWYEVLALLPGFKSNRAFMEQMMGVRQPLPDEIVDRILADLRGGRMRDGLALLRSGTGLVRRWFALPRQMRKFSVRLEDALEPLGTRPDLSAMRGGELVAHYHDLEAQLLKRWDAPLVNDFFAMIFTGLLEKTGARWLPEHDRQRVSELLGDCGEIVSAEPPRRIREMAEMCARDRKTADILADPAVGVREKWLRATGPDGPPGLATALAAYLEKFGDRCLEELKLESPTVVDDPGRLLEAIGALAQRGENLEPPAALEKPTIPQLGNPVKQWVFRRVLENARRCVRNRENLRFERTRLFGRVRAIMRELGARLVADGALDAPEDIFYLELGEVLGLWDGTAVIAEPAALAALARARRKEFEGFSAGPNPPDRFIARGPLTRLAHEISPSAARGNEPPEMTDASKLQGKGACAGVVRGRVRVVMDPREPGLVAGEILVALQTDPGWVVLFPIAAGLLVQRGSLLSHSAIVARELRLPCVVSIADVTSRLQTGDLIEMDGSRGSVQILERHGESTSDGRTEKFE